MRVLVYGAGAVGGALAVRLTLAGADVAVVARGAHADAIRERGLTLVAGATRQTVHLPCVSDTDALPACGVVFVTVKQTHLPAIAQPLSRLQRAGARLVFAMNGIPWWLAADLPIPDPESLVDLLDPGRVLREALVREHLIGGMIQSSNEVVAPGVVLSTTPGRNRLVMGNVVAGADRRIGDIAALLREATYDAYETPDIRREIWNKMSLWLAVAPISVLTGLTLDRIVGDPGGFAAIRAVMHEAIALGRRVGFELDDDVDERITFYRDKPTRTSLLKDFELGREPELASGVLVFEALARAVALPCPHIVQLATLCRLKFAGAGSASAA